MIGKITNRLAKACCWCLMPSYRLLKQPGPLFDTQYYLRQVPELAASGQDPIIHFLRKGWRTGIKPNPLFDPHYYMQQNPDVDFSRINPFVHFLRQEEGQDCKTSTSPYFDPQFYRNNYPDVAENGGHPLLHYLQNGAQEKRRPSVYFDTEWYLDKTPTLWASEMDPLSHYFNYGIKEQKSPSPLFDPLFYAATYNVQEDGDLFDHYLQHGARVDQWPCKWFDPTFYRKTYLQQAGDGSEPLEHYLTRGVQEGLYPNKRIQDLAVKPTISIIIPVYNVEPCQLNNCIRSVLYQSYPHWEVCLADDCSTREEVRPLLEKWAKTDDRIKLKFLETNLGISGATNGAATLAGGDYLCFLDNDDELAPDCLYSLVKHINAEKADLYYSDEELIGADGRKFNVFAKPGFNAELLLCHNYVTHLVAVKKALFDQAGGFDPKMDGAQDFDLFLRLSEAAEKIVHIPEVLYCWRASESSTSINHAQKEYANEAGRRAVESALERRQIVADVELTDWKFYYRTRRHIVQEPLVSIIVFWDQKTSAADGWLQALFAKAGYENYQCIFLAEDGDQCRLIEQFSADRDIPVICRMVDEGQGLASLYNDALNDAEGELVAFVSSDLEIRMDGWLASLVEYGQLDEVGMVGGRLNCIADHLDVVTPAPDCTSASPVYYARFIQDCSVLMNGLQCAQEVQSVGWELCMIRTSLLRELGGYNENFPLLLSNHDLCYRLLEKGLKNIYTPYSAAIWRADARRFWKLSNKSIWSSEKKSFQAKWRDLLRQGDPYYNLLTLREKDVSPEQFMEWLLD